MIASRGRADALFAVRSGAANSAMFSGMAGSTKSTAPSSPKTRTAPAASSVAPTICASVRACFAALRRNSRHALFDRSAEQLSDTEQLEIPAIARSPYLRTQQTSPQNALNGIIQPAMAPFPGFGLQVDLGGKLNADRYSPL